MKEDNGNGQTEELIKLYQNDPISHQVIRYLLSKYKIIPLNAIESIRLHREEILLNIVMVYKKMWDARGKIMLKAMQSGDKPMRIIIKERGKDESISKEGKTKSSGKDGETKRNDIERESGEDIDKKNSNKT